MQKWLTIFLWLTASAVAQEPAALPPADATQLENRLDLLEQHVNNQELLSLRRLEGVEGLVTSLDHNLNRVLLIFAGVMLLSLVLIINYHRAQTRLSSERVNRAVRESESLMRDIHHDLLRPEMEFLRIGHFLRQMMRNYFEQMPDSNAIAHARNYGRDPNLPMSLHCIAQILVAEYEKRWNDAAGILEQLRQLEPKDPFVLLHLSGVHRQIAERYIDKQDKKQHTKLANQYYAQYAVVVRMESAHMTEAPAPPPHTLPAQSTPAAPPAAPSATPPPIVATPPPVAETSPPIVATPPIVEKTPPLVAETPPLVAETPPPIATPPPVTETPPIVISPPPAAAEVILKPPSALQSPPPAPTPVQVASPISPPPPAPPVTIGKPAIQPTIPPAPVAKSPPKSSAVIVSPTKTALSSSPPQTAINGKAAIQLSSIISPAQIHRVVGGLRQAGGALKDGSANLFIGLRGAANRVVFNESPDKMPFLPVPLTSNIPEATETVAEMDMWKHIRQGDLRMAQAENVMNIRRRNYIIDQALTHYAKAQGYKTNETLYLNWGLAFLGKALHLPEKKRDPFFNAAIDKFLAGNVIIPHHFDFALASLYGIIGRAADCRKWLQQSQKFGKLNQESLRTAPDFDNVRNLPWFTEFMRD